MAALWLADALALAGSAPDMLGSQRCDLVHAQMQHGIDKLLIEIVHQSRNASGPSECKGPPDRSTNCNSVRSQRERFGDIHTPPDAAVHDDRRIALYGIRN